MSDAIAKAREKTIADFGAQWTRYVDNDGYYAGQELFADLVEPLIPVADFKDARVADIGAGTGRIVAMIARAGAKEVVAVEPSAAFEALARNVAEFGERVRCVKAPGEAIPREGFDIVTSIGVLHHVPDPAPVVRAAYEALRPGGRLLVWLYGREGNAFYLAFALPLRAVTRRLPVAVNAGIAFALDIALAPYVAACKRFPKLPMADYMAGVLGRFDGRTRRLTIVDQLNPEWAKYYRRTEAEALLADAGFADVQLHHRHGYSWTVVGTRAGGSLTDGAPSRHG